MSDNELFVPQSPSMEENARSLAQTTLSGPATPAGPSAPVDAPKVNLDAQGNPLLARFTTERDRKLAALPPVISVDWRGQKAKDCKGPGQLRAAQVQRVATAAPDGAACVPCGKGFGPFTSCRVLVVDGEPWFGGACANCAFNAGGKACSFRSATTLLPEWVRSELESQNPNHPSLREPTETANPRSTKRRAVSTPVSSPAGEASDRSAKKRARRAIEKQQVAEEEEEVAAGPDTVEVPDVAPPVGRYANVWYSSPLDDKRFSKKGTDWDLVREALQVLPETVARAAADYQSLYAYARDNGELPEDVEEESENPFYGKYQ